MFYIQYAPLNSNALKKIDNCLLGEAKEDITDIISRMRSSHRFLKRARYAFIVVLASILTLVTLAVTLSIIITSPLYMTLLIGSFGTLFAIGTLCFNEYCAGKMKSCLKWAENVFEKIESMERAQEAYNTLSSENALQTQASPVSVDEGHILQQPGAHMVLSDTQDVSIGCKHEIKIGVASENNTQSPKAVVPAASSSHFSFFERGNSELSRVLPARQCDNSP